MLPYKQIRGLSALLGWELADEKAVETLEKTKKTVMA